ncbi:hypothetical protein [Enterococcus faecalis]|uniref:hypothetical protein n=1 Tax=Enterococcus faecalis TaxID=1351 RepID=UPI0031828E54
MHENHVNEKETAVANTERIAKNYAYERPAIQTALFILWRGGKKKKKKRAPVFFDGIKKVLIQNWSRPRKGEGEDFGVGGPFLKKKK